MDDLRIKGYNALLTPNYVKEEFPIVRKKKKKKKKKKECIFKTRKKT
jgi:3-deoxy-7-phosphoheptulonate synthase